MMPDLTARGFSYRHTLASAFQSLICAGVPESRIVFRYDGSGGAPGFVMEQFPVAGEPLDNIDQVVLTISGFGFFHDLPFGMRVDVEDEDTISTWNIMSLFDSEAVRFGYWRDECPLFFGIGPGRAAANERWLRLFGLAPELWPAEKHFDLCCLLPILHRTAGTEEGIRLVLDRLLGLKVAQFRYSKEFCEVSGEDRNRLDSPGTTAGAASEGARNLQMGLNCVLGLRLEKTRDCELILGPVSLDEYRHFTSEEGKRRIKQALDLCMPLGIDCRYRFIAGDRERGIELGRSERNAMLGINSHLGRLGWTSAHESRAL